MKRICNYIDFKIESSKIYIFATILIIYIFASMLFLLKTTSSRNFSYNIYDYIIEIFSYLSLFYTIGILFVVMIYKIFDKGNFYNYLSVRFNSSMEIYNAKILTSLIFSVGTVVFIVVICLLTGSFIRFSNTWSQYSAYVMGSKLNQSYVEPAVNIVRKNLSPLSYTLILCGLSSLYLFFISIVFNICNLIFKQRALSFISVISINILNMVVDSGTLSKFSFTNNIYILNASVNELNNGTYIVSRFLYWIALIVIMYIIGAVLTKKRECDYGK